MATATGSSSVYSIITAQHYDAPNITFHEDCSMHTSAVAGIQPVSLS